MEDKNQNGRMLAVKYLPKYTYKDLELWEGNWELIDGIPFAMSPAPGFIHQRISNKLAYLFEKGLLEENCEECVPVSPMDYKINENTVVQPDLLILCNPVEGHYVTSPPILLVEILSPSTMAKDRNLKFHLYEQQNIRYYLIVDSEKETLEIFEIREGNYQLSSMMKNELNTLGSYQFGLEADCNPTIDFTTLFRR